MRSPASLLDERIADQALEFIAAQDYGLDFQYIEDLTEEILCRDLDDDGQTDWLLVVNTDQPSWLYLGN
jgi:hypothetical protein